MNNADQLGKILAVERIIQDNPCGISVKKIIEKLNNEYGITADRRSIYNNINCLTRFLPIYAERRGRGYFYCLQRSNAE